MASNPTPIPAFFIGSKMDQRKAFLFFGFMILIWTIFWNVGLRTLAVRRAAQTGNSPALQGLLVAV